MPELHEVSYSREATIAAFRDYYQFLTKMYMPETMIDEPPTGGWPSITNEKVRLLGKNEEVAELMRHLPYLSDNGVLATGAECAHWPDLFAEFGRICVKDMRFCTEDLGWENVPPTAFGILFDRDCRIVLDTKFGVIHWVDGVREEANTARDCIPGHTFWDCTPDNEDWRCGPAWSIPDFFEVLKQLHRDLVYIPIHEARVEEWFDEYETSDHSPYLPPVRKVYREHGWPDLSVYKKKECMEAVQKLLEERFDAWY